MGILGNDSKGSIKEQGNGCILSMNQVKEIQKILLMILEDVDKICRENNINYVLIGGTAIGCVRHKGFIPWDDDIDIAMPRADYERFLQIIKANYHDKYELTDSIRKNNYGKLIPKFRLKGTTYRTRLDVEPKDKEIKCDVFVIENVSDNKILRFLQGSCCLLMGFLLSCRRLAEKKEYFSKIYKGRDFKLRVAIGNVLKLASLKTWAYWTECCYSMSSNASSKFVTVPTDRCHFFKEMFRREVMCTSVDVEFEGKKFKIPKEYDFYLEKRYGDYMKIPSVEEQVLSIYSELDYGKYKDIVRDVK